MSISVSEEEFSLHTAHHFVVDLVEVDLADFLHDVLVLKRHEAETCFGRNEASI